MDERRFYETRRVDVNELSDLNQPVVSTVPPQSASREYLRGDDRVYHVMADDDDDSSDDDDLFGAPEELDVAWSDDDAKVRTFTTPLKLDGIGSDSSDASDKEADDDDDDVNAYDDVQRPSEMSSGRDGRGGKRASASASTQSPVNKRSITVDVPSSVKEGETSAAARAQALLIGFDELARPAVPAYVPAERVAEVVEDDGSDEEDIREVSDVEGDEVEDDFCQGDVGEDLMKLVFQLPTGEKFDRYVGRRWTFERIIKAWRKSADWELVTLALGDATGLRVICDGDVVRGGDTPLDFDLDDGDTLDLMKPGKA